MKKVLRNTKLINYFEFFITSMEQIANFDPEFQNSLDDVLRIRTKTSINLLSLQASGSGISPT